MENKSNSEVKGFVYVAVGVAAIGGLLFGYDTGVISGAIIFVKTQFSLSANMEELVVSSVLAGAPSGSMVSLRWALGSFAIDWCRKPRGRLWSKLKRTGARENHRADYKTQPSSASAEAYVGMSIRMLVTVHT